MSLINEALKKAQRQRSLDSAPLSSAPSGIAAAAVSTHVRAASHRRRNHAPVWFGLGLLVLGAGATVLIMRYGFVSEPAVAASPAPATSPAAATNVAPVSPPPAPMTTTPAPVAETPSIMLPPMAANTPPPAPATAPAPAAATIPPAAAAPVAEPPVAVVPLPPAATPAEQEARVYEFLSTARLTGVRGVDNNARVLMNERVYRLNDVVDVPLGLRISAVRPGLLVFTDVMGKTYEKPY